MSGLGFFGIGRRCGVQCRGYDLGSRKGEAFLERVRGCRLLSKDYRWQVGFSRWCRSIFGQSVSCCWLAVKLRYDAAPRPQRIRWCFAS